MKHTDLDVLSKYRIGYSGKRIAQVFEVEVNMEMLFSVMKTPSRYPQLAETWNNTGNAFKNEGRYVDAINCYDRAIDIDPKLAKAWYNKGLALQKLSLEKEAQVALIMAMKLGHIASHTIQT